MGITEFLFFAFAIISMSIFFGVLIVFIAHVMTRYMDDDE